MKAVNLKSSKAVSNQHFQIVAKDLANWLCKLLSAVTFMQRGFLKSNRSIGFLEVFFTEVLLV